MDHDKGVKFDDGKSRLDLLSPAFLRDIAKKLEEGETKYGPKNYLKGLDENRVIAAALRHIFEIMDGKWADETGTSHVGAVGANMQMLHEIHEGKMQHESKPESDNVKFSQYSYIRRSMPVGKTQSDIDKIASGITRGRYKVMEDWLSQMLVDRIDDMRSVVFSYQWQPFNPKSFKIEIKD